MFMPIHLRAVPAEAADTLVPVLLDADEGEARVRATLADPAHSSYAVLEGEALIGAATLRWEPEESEIVYIAVAPERRGQGVGKAIIALLLDEARRHGTRAVLVGTANSSLENIAFYQKCGFRMDHVRRDYFSYIQPPISEHGIPMRDMIVLRYDMSDMR
jgi:ribosomal protein S18 acetylase RimI-like enzyme